MRSPALLAVLGFTLTAGPSAASTISGVVRDESGKPLPDVTVALVPPRMHDLGGPLYSVRSDTRGHYVLQKVPAGPHTVVAYGNDLVTSAEVAVEVPAEGDVEAELVTPHAVSISGQLLDVAGEPVHAVLLAGRGYNHEHNSRQSAGDTAANHTQGVAETDKLGHFEMRGLAPGPVSLSIHVRPDPHHPAARGSGVDFLERFKKETSLLTVVAPATGLVLRLPGERSLTGTIADAAGQAMADVRLDAMSVDDTTGRVGGSVEPDGSFAIGGLGAGKYWLTLTSNQREWAFPATVPSSKPLQLVFPKLQDLSGTVRKPSGLAGDVVVGAYRDSKDDVAAGRLPSTLTNSVWVKPAADGTWKLAGLVPGRYHLQASMWADKQSLKSAEQLVDVGAAGLALVVPPPEATAQ